MTAPALATTTLRPPFARCAVCCAAIMALTLAAGCQPVQVVQPVIPGQWIPGGLFAAPPAPATAGVPLDPFAAVPFDGSAATSTLPPDTLPPDDAPFDGGPTRLHIPVANAEWTWEQLVDVFDDYFRVARERQVTLVGDVMTEGRIESYPQVGATVLEPHRLDSVGRYNRWESTFQTIRRRAAVRVIPDTNGYIVDVSVEKDLEDLPRPLFGTAGAASFRNDDSLTSDRAEFVSPRRLATNWILVGRDVALERTILADVQQRLAAPVTGQPLVMPAEQ